MRKRGKPRPFDDVGGKFDTTPKRESCLPTVEPVLVGHKGDLTIHGPLVFQTPIGRRNNTKELFAKVMAEGGFAAAAVSVPPMEGPPIGFTLMLQANRGESRRLHLDWYGLCRTCANWGDKVGAWKRGSLDVYVCGCSESELSGQHTTSSGLCPKWESFDPEVESELKAEWDRGENPGE